MKLLHLTLSVAAMFAAVPATHAGDSDHASREVHGVKLTSICKDGSTQTFEQTTDPDLDEGDVVKVENGHPVKHAS